MDELADKQAITEAIYTYCRSVDRLDIPLGQAIWHDDGWADYGEGQYQGPGRGVIEHICAAHAGLASHSHQVSNILITLDGDAAGSEAYMTGTMRMERDGRTMQITMWARYIDQWARRDGRWGLVRRSVVTDHSEMREVSPGPAVGLPASRDRDDPSYAVLEAGA